MLFNVSDVGLHLGAADGADDVQVVVEKAPGVKCARCWRFVPERSDRTGVDWGSAIGAATR